MNLIDSLIFDVDGTLWDAVPVTLRAWNRAVETATGVPDRIRPKDAYACLGMTLEDMAIRLFPEMEAEAGRALLNACFAQEDVVLAETVPDLFPGVKETLIALSQTLPLYIVSNCQLGYIDRLVEGHGLQGVISGWLCWGDTHQEKHVTMSRLVERYGLKHPVYVGDTLGDQRSCQRAGIPFVFAAYGFGEAVSPDWTVERFADLTKLIAEIKE